MINNFLRAFIAVTAIASAPIFLSACDEGTFEETGEEIDETAEELGEGEMME